MLAFIDKVLVGLIGDNDEIVLFCECGDFFRFGAREDDTGRILRRVEVDGARGGRGVVLQRRGEAVAPRCGGRDHHRSRLGQRDHVADGSPEGGENEYVVAGIEHGLEGNVEGMRSAARSR